MEDECRIVVVDDMPDAAQSLSDVLSAGGYTVRAAHDGADALLLIESWQPHCVLLDVNMPGLNGLELARNLRTYYGDSIVLIAVTGGDDEDPLVKQTFDCVDHYLRKPDYLRALMKVLPPLNRPRPGASGAMPL
jgi:CheY-like chemotaxis protein